MHAFLIVGNNPEKEIASRIALWKISVWDTIYLPHEGTIGIDLVRDFERELILMPRNSRAKVGVLTDMDRLTPEAQNALLKTLEEPPPHTYIIGTTTTPEALLPTIVSRMNVVRLTDTETASDATLLHTLLSSSPGKILSAIEPYVATRDDAKTFVTSLLEATREELLARPTPRLTALIRNLLMAQSQLSVNVNPKLVMDNAILQLV